MIWQYAVRSSSTTTRTSLTLGEVLRKDQHYSITFGPFIAGHGRCLGRNLALLFMLTELFIALWRSRITFKKQPERVDEVLMKQSVLVTVLDMVTLTVAVLAKRKVVKRGFSFNT